MPGTGIRHSQQHAAAASYIGGSGGTFSPTARPLPEHEAQYPATASIRAYIAAHWTDGDVGTAREVGHQLHNAAGEPYPSWRVVDIARMPATAPSAPEPIAPSKKETIVSQFATLSEPSPDQPEPDEPTETPTETPAESEDAPSPAPDTLTCEDCGVSYASWRSVAVRGQSYPIRICQPCHLTRYRAGRKRAADERAAALPVIEPESPPPTTLAKWPAKPAQDAPAPPQEPQERPPLRIPPGSFDAPAATDGELVTALRDDYRATPAPSPRRQLRASLHTLVDALPDGDAWPECERARWMEAFTGLLDFALERQPDAARWRVGQ